MQWVIDLVGSIPTTLREIQPVKKRPKESIQVTIRFLRGQDSHTVEHKKRPSRDEAHKAMGRIVIQLSISSVLRVTQVNDQKCPSGDAARKEAS
ncbi:unnamed protein product [Prunus armeniaca]